MDLGAMGQAAGVCAWPWPWPQTVCRKSVRALGHRSQVGFDRFLEQTGLLRRQAPPVLTPKRQRLCSESSWVSWSILLWRQVKPVLRDEQLAQGVGVQFVEIGGESHDPIMPPAHPCGHPASPMVHYEIIRITPSSPTLLPG